MLLCGGTCKNTEIKGGVYNTDTTECHVLSTVGIDEVNERAIGAAKRKGGDRQKKFLPPMDLIRSALY